MSRPRLTGRVTSLTLATALVMAVSACTGADSSTPRTPADPTAAEKTSQAGTPLVDVDTTALVVRRAPFCDAVEPAAVARALDTQEADVTAYRSGQRIRIGKVSDVVHEFGCRWTVDDSVAEAWVFAPPITRERATRLARAVRDGCPGAAGPAFGEPWGRCLRDQGRKARLVYGGLFGDAWLGCALTKDADATGDVETRGEEWCAAVAMGAAATGR